MNILFTAVGITDPIQNFHDGAILHICRNYDIDIVYLFMSGEIYKNHLHDNRYLYCLDKLSEHRCRKMKYEIIARENLADVHVFDTFIDEFHNIIDQIHTDYPEDKIYLNVSSGTPAMKSALQVLAAFVEYPVIPVQVSTPERASNPKVEEKIDYKAEEQWDVNEDNSDEVNRCVESRNANFITEIKKKMVQELILKYDYVGALELANNFVEKESPFLKLLNAAIKRNSLESNKAYSEFANQGYILSRIDTKDRMVAEYMLKVHLRVKKGEYADFLRSITPLIVNLYERLLKDRFGLDINNFCKNVQKNRWDFAKLSKEKTDIFTIFQKAYGDKLQDEIKSDNLCKIIEDKETDKKLLELFTSVRDFEKKARNIAAHEMQKITDEWIKEQTGISSAEFLKKLRHVFTYTSISFPDGYVNSYDEMNKFMLDVLNLVE